MTKTSLAAFMKRLRRDGELQTAFAEFASAHGFHFDEDELGEADLDGVAGGIDTVPLPERPMLRTARKKAAVKKKTIRRKKKAVKKKATRRY